jgi:undecaprenyl-diphosphatase
MNTLRRIFFGLLLLALAFARSAYAENSASSTLVASAGPDTSNMHASATSVVVLSPLTYTDAAVLGLVEGATEFLPVSSIGHTILATHALGLDRQMPLLDRTGQPIILFNGHGEKSIDYEDPPGSGQHHVLQWVDNPGNSANAGFLTLKDAVDVYNVMVQAGPIAAILLLYWRRGWSLLRGVAGRDPQGLLLLRNLVLAFLPAATLGFVGGKWIHAHLFSYQPVAAALVAGALVMLAAEHWCKKKSVGIAEQAGPELHELSCRQALLIGACQCASLWPGTSRSMTTIVGGYLVGLRPARAAEFSFLLGLLTLTAASGYEAVGHLAELRAGLPMGPLVLGIVVATLAALITVRWFVGWIAQRGLEVFAWYRLALAAAVFWVMKG